MKLESLKSMFSDMHKEVHGFRPRGFIMSSTSVEEVQAEIDSLLVESVRVAAEEDRQQTEAVAQFEAHIASLIEMGADNREAALRWIHDAEDTNGDARYLEHAWGLPYHYIACAAA
jgi:hypothetical protein